MSASTDFLQRIRRVAVVGAGITGLSAALRLIQQHDGFHIDLFEASSRPGGTIYTEHRDGFLIEHGPDAFITNKPGGLQLCSDLGITDKLIGTDDQHRCSLVVHRGRPVPVPEGFMLMAPASLKAILTTPILSVGGKLRLLSEAVRPRKKTDDDESLGSFVRRRFGKETFERLVQPLVGGIYTSDPEKLSLKATLPRFLAMEQEHGSVIRATLRENRSAGTRQLPGESGVRYGLFTTHADGLSSIITSIVSALESSGRVRLHLNTPIEAIEPLTKTTGWHLKCDRHNDLSCHGLILTTPSFVTGRLLANVDPNMSGELKAIEYASTAIVVSAHRLSDFRHPLNAFGLIIPSIENRNVLAVSFSSRKFPDRAPQGYVLIRTFVGGATQPGLFRLSDDDIRETVAIELKYLLGMSETPQFSSVLRHERAMPQYHVGHIDRISRIEERISRHHGLELGGIAYHGVGVPDCISNGYAAADRMAEFVRL